MNIKLLLSLVFVVLISFSFGISDASAQGGWWSNITGNNNNNSNNNDADPFPNTGNFDNIQNTSGNGAGNNSGANSNALSSCKNMDNFGDVVTCFTSMINITIPVIIGLAVFIFVWGLIKYITAGGDEDQVAEARKFMLFGIIAIFVMVSVWGLVGILVNTFFSGGVAIPQLK